MIRRAFLQRMATAALGCGLLGTELLSRQPTWGWQQATATSGDAVFEVGKTYTIEQMGPDGEWQTYRGCEVMNIEVEEAHHLYGDVTKITFGKDMGFGGVITWEGPTP